MSKAIQKAKTSPATTTGGLVGAVCVLVVLLANALGLDPETVTSLTRALEAVAVIAVSLGLMAARDNKTTSEAAGAKVPGTFPPATTTDTTSKTTTWVKLNGEKP